MATSRGNTGRQFKFCSSQSEAPPKLAKLLSCRYVDEFGETKTVTYEAGKPQGFMPQGQHLPVIPRPSSGGGNVDDEFGTDEDWQSVDADQDGIPDPPRPKDQRTTPIVQARPPPPTFIPASQQARQNIKVSFILGEVAKKEGIRVTEEQIRMALAQISMRQKISPKKLMADAKKNNLIERLQDDLLLENALNFLKQHAEVEEVEAEKEDCGHDHSH